METWKSLIRFRCVRKSWSLLFENSYFMNMFQRNFLSNDQSYNDDTSLLSHHITLWRISRIYASALYSLAVRGLIILSNWIGQILFKSNLTLTLIFMAMPVLMEFFVLKTRRELGTFIVFKNYGELYCGIELQVNSKLLLRVLLHLILHVGIPVLVFMDLAMIKLEMTIR